MWYELIPCMSLITACLAGPTYFIYGYHKVIFGNAYGRKMEDSWDHYMYTRDHNITGDAYKVSGLESIPDEGQPINNKRVNKRLMFPKF